MADFSHRQTRPHPARGLRGFLPRPLYRQLPVLFRFSSLYFALSPPLRRVSISSSTARRSPLPPAVLSAGTALHWLSTAESLQSRRSPSGLSGSTIAARGHQSMTKTIVSGLRIPAFHRIPLGSNRTPPAFAVQPHRRQGCNGRVFLTQHPLLSEGVSGYEAVEYALFTRPLFGPQLFPVLHAR